MKNICNLPEVRLRLGEAEDVPVIVEVERLAFDGEPIAPLDKSTIIQRLMAMEHFLMLVAEHNGRVIGHLLAYPKNMLSSPGKLYLWSGAVHPEFQSQEVMTTILIKIFEIAHERGFKFLFFDTSSNNRKMLRLALNAGFEIARYRSREWRDTSGNWLASVTPEKEL